MASSEPLRIPQLMDFYRPNWFMGDDCNPQGVPVLPAFPPPPWAVPATRPSGLQVNIARSEADAKAGDLVPSEKVQCGHGTSAIYR